MKWVLWPDQELSRNQRGKHPRQPSYILGDDFGTAAQFALGFYLPALGATKQAWLKEIIFCDHIGVSWNDWPN
jgi:hypothetical protein